MAYSRKNLSGSIGGGSGAPLLYTFRDTGSSKATMDVDDYFLDLNDILKVGDAIVAHGSDGVVVFGVTAVSATTVTVEEATLA